MTYDGGMRSKDELADLLREHTTTEIARRTGLSPRTISRYRVDKFAPSYASMARIEAAFPTKRARKSKQATAA